MKKLFIIAIIIASFSIVCFMEAYATDESDKSDLEMQKKCAQMSEQRFTDHGFNPKNVSHEFHYNKKLKKCFMTVLSKDGRDKDVYIAKYLIDVFEDKIYGEYYWKTEEGKIPLEVKLLYCTMLDKTSNATQEEYDAFVKPYMEE